MSLSNPTSRRAALALLAGALAGCGFTPVYAPGGTGSKLQGRVLVAAPENRESYLLVQRIEERLGRASTPAYNLSLSLETQERRLGIDPSGDADRVNFIGIAGYILTDNATGVQLSSGTVNNFTGYSTTGSTVDTLASERDASARLMVILGDQIVTRLLSTELP